MLEKFRLSFSGTGARMSDWVEYLNVVPNYNFIVTVFALAMAIYWRAAKVKQLRLESLFRKMWERRNQDIRYRKTQKIIEEGRLGTDKNS